MHISILNTLQNTLSRFTEFERSYFNARNLGNVQCAFCRYINCAFLKVGDTTTNFKIPVKISTSIKISKN